MNEPLDALVLGAGFSGCYQLHRLRQEGFNVLLLEGGAALGGVWHWNCYPGARVDSHVPNYEFSMKEVWRDWYWTERFPGWQELRDYFQHVDEKLQLSSDIRFNSWVEKAVFDEDSNLWEVTCTDGFSVKTHFFLTCTGFAAKPYTPNLPGLASFDGIACHTAHWPQAGIDMTDLRVGIIGTGASGVQMTQEASKVAAEVTVYQRTPMIALPMQQRTFDKAYLDAWKKDYPRLFQARNDSNGGLHDIKPDKRAAKEVPASERNARFEWAWNEGGFHFWAGTFGDILTDAESNRLAYEFWRDRTRARIDDPETAGLLAPDDPPHPFGTKRPSLEQWYFDAFNQHNVSLVDLKQEPIDQIQPTGIKTNQRFTELDLLVLATGFDASTGGLTQIELVGTDGRTLREHWADGVNTFLGLNAPCFPNLLMLYGPQSPTAFWNGPTSAEVQGEWVVTFLKWLRRHGKQRFETTAETASHWTDYIKEVADMTLLPKAKSWYMGANIPGKNVQLLHHPGIHDYMEHCNAAAAEDYKGFLIE